MSKSKIKVVELFAGVGGFRIGLEGYKGKSASSKFEKKIKSNFEVVWSNQYEPSTKIQHANLVYKNRWPKANHSENDIEKLKNRNVIVECDTNNLKTIYNVLYQIRCNIFHGEKVPGEINDDRIVSYANPILKQIVTYLVKDNNLY